jgi:hypothetical protein
MVTSVSLLAVTIPELRNPMSAMNSPMPTATAAYNSTGMEDTIICRKPTAVKIRNAIPERKTAPSAVSQRTPMPFTTL